MDIPIDRRRYNKNLLILFLMPVMFIVFVFYALPVLANDKHTKFPLFYLSAVMIIQVIFISNRIVKMIRLKNSGQPAMSLQFGYLTDNTQLFIKVKDLDIRTVQSVDRLRQSKNKLVRYKLTIKKESLQGNLIKRLIARRVVLNDMLVDTAQLEELAFKIDEEISGHLKNSSPEIRL